MSEIDQRRVLRVRGVVQGVGFRPFVYALAASLRLAGNVRNATEGVVVEIEGSPSALDEFQRRLPIDAPPNARVDAVEVSIGDVRSERGFRILESTPADASRPTSQLPPDLAVCDDCLAELSDPGDRRYRYPFITCSWCGPRFTIATAMPYDRDNTTMAGFPLCSACRAEYDDPTDRRFHAQPLACPDCGPRLELTDTTDRAPANSEAALREAQRILDAGGIVAVKGIGGFQLMCDATNRGAVATLRTRKRRGDKPFAVMVAGPETVAGVLDATSAQLRVLWSPQRPIVLMRKPVARTDAVPDWVEAVAPGAADVGVMLPSAPVHHLLLRGLGTRIVVCTSGNLADEPIVTDDDDARSRLRSIADAWLGNDRPIRTPCDDSVVRVMGERVTLVRRSRGWAPLAVDIAGSVGGRSDRLPGVLAIGGDLKGVVCLAQGHHAWLSQHLGDFGELSTFRAAREAIDQLLALTQVQPEVVAVDAHPGYLSSRLGRELAAELGLALTRVQHHHAHVASLLAETGPARASAEPVIGVAFDGTGYGDDGAIWGGEILVADAAQAIRVAHLGYVALPGGDAAIEHPARTALAHLSSARCEWDDRLAPVQAVDDEARAVIRTQLDRGIASVPTSSMGRLFDAVASLCGVCQQVGYEAQAAIELEAIADRGAAGAYSFGPPDPFGAIDAGPVIAAVVADVLSGVPAPVVSMRFHRGVAQLVHTVAQLVRAERSLNTVALTGGVFQNMLVLECCFDRLERDGFEVLCHQNVPPNDGGLSLGQALVAGVARNRQE